MVDIYQTANWEITYPPLSSTVWYNFCFSTYPTLKYSFLPIYQKMVRNETLVTILSILLFGGEEYLLITSKLDNQCTQRYYSSIEFWN